MSYNDDIDPKSQCRLPLPERSHLDPAAQKIFDTYVKPGGSSLRGLRGPGGLRLHSSGLTKCNKVMLEYFRSEASYSGRVREIAILTTARCCSSQFEWAAHEQQALKEGVPKETIEVIRNELSVDTLEPTDAALVTLGREIFRNRKLSSKTYSTAFAIFGARTLVDLVSLMGYYSATAVLLTAFDMQLDPGVAAPFPT